MERRDARKLNPLAQEEVRRQAIKLHERGFTRLVIAEQLEVHRNTVGQWISHYRTHGLKPKNAVPKKERFVSLILKSRLVFAKQLLMFVLTNSKYAA